MNHTQLFCLDGRTALVTGASSGLGVTFAEALAAAGARVVIAARRVDKLREVEQRITATGAEAMSVQCDVGDPAQVEAAVEAACRDFGRLDIMVNNAGIAAEVGAVPENIPHELFEETIRINLLGTWYGCREAGRRMLADGRGGSIINIASICGLGAYHDFPSAYQASKAAVINLTRNLAVSWAERGVRVNALAPGWFASEMTEGVLSLAGFKKWVEDGAAMRRLGAVEELIGPLLFLASDASSYVTGETLVVDGGASAAMGVSACRRTSINCGKARPAGWGRESPRASRAWRRISAVKVRRFGLTASPQIVSASPAARALSRNVAVIPTLTRLG